MKNPVKKYRKRLQRPQTEELLAKESILQNIKKMAFSIYQWIYDSEIKLMLETSTACHLH
jgi:hypothetical protein